MFCGGCGSQVSEGSRFCQKCGRPVASAAPAPVAAPPSAYSAQPAAAPPPAPPYPPQPAPAAVYAAPQVAVPYVGASYGGFWLRFVAIIVDGIIIGIPLGIIAAVVFGVFGGMAMMRGAIPTNPDPEATLAQATVVSAAIFGFVMLLIFGSIVVKWLYFAIMESSARQATLGKSIMGLRVTDLNGNRISFGRASGRYFAKIISDFTFFIGYIMAGFTEKKQALHDMIAGTLVIRAK